MQQFLDLLLKSVKEEEELVDQEMTKGKYQESEKFKKSSRFKIISKSLFL
jgi:hypothetical protein